MNKQINRISKMWTSARWSDLLTQLGIRMEGVYSGNRLCVIRSCSSSLSGVMQRDVSKLIIIEKQNIKPLIGQLEASKFICWVSRCTKA